MLNKLLKEPFLYFLLIGGSVFLGFGQSAPEKPSIELTAEIYNSFTGKDDAAKNELIDKYFEGEVFFREGLKRGLHKGDAEIRDRIIMSMQYLLAGQIETPDDSVLTNFYNDNPTLYTTDAKVSFDHYFFENDPSLNTNSILENLRAGEEPEGADDFWLGKSFTRYEEPVLRQILGDEFWGEINTPPLETWTGPLKSSRGYHFVFVNKIEAARTLSYGFVKDRVLEDWVETQRRQKIGNEIAKLKENYTLILPDQK